MPFASSDDRLAAVKSATGSVRDPETGRPLLSVAQVQWEQQADAAHRLDVRIPRYSAPLLEHLRDQLQDAVNANAELSADSIEVVVGLVENERPVPRTGTAQVRIKSVIAVGSGKGGVGKSTVSAGLAISLQRSGARVGLMDADVYGPSIPTMLGVAGQPEVVDNQIVPLWSNGLPVMSMGLLVPASEADLARPDASSSSHSFCS
ncbi:MAG: P-loop NTPase [Pirellulaceae bacterium]